MGLGPVVRDGELRYVSVSQLERFDERCDGGCERKWWFRYVAHVPDGFKVATDLGQKVHAQLEHYLLTGDRAPLGDIALTALPHAPEPGALVMTELAYGEPHHDAVVSPVHLDGAAVVGRLDLLVVRGDEVEVLDWKTTGSIERWAKSAEVMARTWQMRGYVPVALTVRPATERVRLSHVYMQTRGPRLAVKRTAVVPARETAEAFIAEGSAMVARMRVVAATARVEDVRANPLACGAYGGCPYRAQCPRSLAMMLPGLLDRAGQAESEVSHKRGCVDGGGLVSLLAKRKAEQGMGDAVEVEKAKLLAEEGVSPPDAPADAPAAAPLPAGTIVGCPDGGRERELTADEAAAKSVACSCGAQLKVKPVALGAAVRALVPLHDRGEAPKKAAKKVKAEAAPPVEPGGYELYLDASVDGVALTRLEPVAAELAAEIAAANNVVDVRMGGSGPLGFAQWRGALAAAARERPMSGALACSSSSELGMVVFEALAPNARRVVRGTR